MTTATANRPLAERALDVLRRAGNPFRNYFARNPDDDTCSRYHVPELYAAQREQLLAVVDLYRYAPTTHSESAGGVSPAQHATPGRSAFPVGWPAVRSKMAPAMRQ